MPVTDQTTTNTYTGNGVTTVFAYSFKALAKADITVTVNGTPKTLTTDYSLSGIGSANGGNVTFVTAPASGAEVVITRDMDMTRDTDYQDNGDLLAATLDEDIDRAVMLIQQVRQITRRSIRAPVAETSVDELPSAASRASKYLAFDADGQPVATAGTTSNIIVSTFIEGLLDDTTQAQAKATLGVYEGVVQFVEATPITTVTACNTVIPADDTIPQSTEGNQVITVSITPTSATNRLRIEFDAPVTSMAATPAHIIAALFQDSTANALAAAVSNVSSGAAYYTSPMRLVHEMPAGTILPTTFKVRVGPSGATTAYLNSNGAGTRLFGGLAAVRLRVTEFAPRA